MTIITDQSGNIIRRVVQDNTPSSIKDLLCWYQAQYQQSVDPIDSMRDGVPINVIKDKSSNGFDLFYNGSRPTWNYGGLRGKPYIQFNGVDTCLSSSIPLPQSAGTARSIFAVVKNESTFTADPQDFVICETGTNVSSGNNHALLMTNDSANFQNGVKIIHYGSVGVNQYSSHSGQFLLQDESIVTGLHDYAGNLATETNMTVNGEFVSMGGGLRVDNLDNEQFDSNILYVGARGGISNFWAGRLYELIIYDRLLTPAEITEVETYLADQYGIYHAKNTWINGYNKVQKANAVQNQLNIDQILDPLKNNNILWLDASKNSSIIKRIGTDYVTKWIDISNNGNDFVQTNMSLQPYYRDNVTNGLPGVQFTNQGPGSRLDSIIPITLSEFTIFMACIAENRAILYEHSEDLSQGGTGSYVVSGINESYRVTRDVGSSAYNIDNDQWAIGGGPKYITHRYKDLHTNHTLAVNSVIPSATAFDTGNPGPTSASQNMHIGARVGSVIPLNGYILEFLVFNKYLTDDSVAIIQDYLAVKYKIR